VVFVWDFLKRDKGGERRGRAGRRRRGGGGRMRHEVR
jgi:hypothetical protein